MTIESFNKFENSEEKKNDSQDFEGSGYTPPSINMAELIAEEENKDEAQALLDFLENGEMPINNEKLPIDNFIKLGALNGLNDEEICFKLLKEGYGKEILDSSLDKNLINKLNVSFDGLYSRYRYKVDDKDTFKNLFFQIAQEIAKNSDSNITPNEFLEKIDKGLLNVKMDSPISMDFIKSYLKQGPIVFNLPYGEKLHGNWSNSKDVLDLISFYDDSFGDDCTFPDGYNPHEVFEKGKSIGLGIETVHEKGYTGKGVKVAIVDNPFLHKDIPVCEYYKSENNPELQFHGAAVSSILVGRETGVAPDANLHFVESASQTDDRDIYENLSKLKDKDIKIISMSFTLYQEWMFTSEELEKGTKDKISGLVKELNENGTWVLSGDEFIKNFGLLGMKNPMGDSDDFKNYQVTRPDLRTLEIREKYINYPDELEDPKGKFQQDFWKETKSMEDLIFINCGDRTVADIVDADDETLKPATVYRHDRIGGTSWAIPAVAGYYALACQADPNMDPERFMQLAGDTAQIVKISDLPEDMTNMTLGRYDISKYNEIPEAPKIPSEIKVLDINALIQRIEDEKNK